VNDTYPFAGDFAKAATQATEQVSQQGRELTEQAARRTREFAEQAAAQTRELTLQAAQQTRDFTDQAVSTGRAYGQLAVDSYEKALSSIVELEQRTAEAAPVDWVKTAVGAHASFVQELGTAYVKAARDVLA
jgi:predicted DNA-binding WGR domain protein